MLSDCVTYKTSRVMGGNAPDSHTLSPGDRVGPWQLCFLVCGPVNQVLRVTWWADSERDAPKVTLTL